MCIIDFSLFAKQPNFPLILVVNVDFFGLTRISFVSFEIYILLRECRFYTIQQTDVEYFINILQYTGCSHMNAITYTPHFATRCTDKTAARMKMSRFRLWIIYRDKTNFNSKHFILTFDIQPTRDYYFILLC